MPIYAYRCDACGHAMDLLQKISDAPPAACPACGAAAMVKQLTAAGFQLKGSGWYVTDFRGGNEAKGKAQAEDGKGETKPEAKADGKADAKTDAKADVKTNASPPAKAPAAGTPDAPKRVPPSTAPASAGSGSAPVQR